MPTIKNNAVIVDSCTQRIQALKEHVSPKTEIVMDGRRYKAADLITIYQATLDGRAALIKSRAQVQVDLAARREAEAERHAIETGLKAWVLAQFGADSNVAHEFGYSRAKVGVKTAEAKARAVLRAQATREARHTMGRKQKEKIKGTVVVPGEPAPPANASPPTSGGAKANGAPAPSNGAVETG